MTTRTTVYDMFQAINETSYGTTPDGTLNYIGANLKAKVDMRIAKEKLFGSGTHSATFINTASGVVIPYIDLSFGLHGNYWETIVKAIMGVAAAGGSYTKTYTAGTSMSFLGRAGDGTAASDDFELINGCLPVSVTLTGEVSKMHMCKASLIGRNSDREPDAAFTGLQTVDLSDNTFATSSTSLPDVWMGGGTTANPFNWDTSNTIGGTPSYTEITAVPFWELTLSRNVTDDQLIISRLTGADTNDYYRVKEIVSGGLDIKLKLKIPETGFGALNENEFQDTYDSDDWVYIQLPCAGQTFTLADGFIPSDPKLEYLPSGRGKLRVTEFEVDFRSISW